MMPKRVLGVEWSERSLKNALSIKKYLRSEFTEKEAWRFENLLRQFGKNVSHFPNLYPASQKHRHLRKAVLHKFTSVFYTIRNDKIFIIAVQDNRQEGPGK